MIMILGAGVYQAPLIEKAKAMGLVCLVASPQGNYPGIPMADIYLDIDTTDVERVISAAKEYAIAAVVTTGTDVSVPTVGAVVEALGLKGPNRYLADTVSSKSAFRHFLRNNRLNSPNFISCENLEVAWGFFRKATSKIVIKPDDSSGSRGISVIEPGLAKEAFADRYAQALKFSRSGLVCAEEFIPGIEVGGDAFFENGEIRFFTVTRKHVEGVLVQGHSLPGCLNEGELVLVQDQIGLAASRLGYVDGPINFDVMLHARTATILEMGLRNGGNGIIDLIRHCYGIDLNEWLLMHVLDLPLPKVDISKARPVSSYVFGTEKPGILKKVPSLQELNTMVPQVFDMVLAKRPGDRVDAFVHNANLIGYLLLNCGAGEYGSVVSRIREVLQVEVET